MEKSVFLPCPDKFENVLAVLIKELGEPVEANGLRESVDEADIAAAIDAAKFISSGYNSSRSNRLSITIRLKFKKWTLEITIGI